MPTLPADYVIETTPGYLVHAAVQLPVIRVQSLAPKVVVVATGGVPGKTGPRGQEGPAGLEGAPGLAGPPGPPLIWRGPWDAEATYSISDLVSFVDPVDSVDKLYAAVAPPDVGVDPTNSPPWYQAPAAVQEGGAGGGGGGVSYLVWSDHYGSSSVRPKAFVGGELLWIEDDPAGNQTKLMSYTLDNLRSALVPPDTDPQPLVTDWGDLTLTNAIDVATMDTSVDPDVRYFAPPAAKVLADGFVRFRGRVQLVGSSGEVCVLSPNLRPQYDVWLPLNEGSQAMNVRIQRDGTMTVVGTGAVDGLEFNLEAITYETGLGPVRTPGLNPAYSVDGQNPLVMVPSGDGYRVAGCFINKENPGVSFAWASDSLVAIPLEGSGANLTVNAMLGYGGLGAGGIEYLPASGPNHSARRGFWTPTLSISGNKIFIKITNPQVGIPPYDSGTWSNSTPSYPDDPAYLPHRYCLDVTVHMT